MKGGRAAFAAGRPMVQLLAYSTIVSAVAAVVLAVARDVPILHLLLPPDTGFGDWSGLIICPPILLAVTFGESWMVAVGWISGIAYFWWVAAWHLRERR
jgi:hypothetical protein